ncbi:MAG TPA: CBS domain-containing protein [Acidimicrobiales bacterium]|jgi:CBS domain-containing protein|nr:CBS domain-containing protein [Acidimicrobiales bacterium]
MPTVQDVMTTDPVALEASKPVIEAAKRMRDEDIGDVIVMEGGGICGVVTDRDIVVRVVANGRDPAQTPLGDVCSRDVATVSPGDDLTVAGDLMRDRAIRRVPVVEDGRPVGIISIGDLAIERDPDSALSHISAAPPS